LMPEGLTASAGAVGTSVVLSVIAALPKTWIYIGVVLPRDGSHNPSPQVAEAESPQPGTLVSGRKNRFPRCTGARRARPGGAHRVHAGRHRADAAHANAPAAVRARASNHHDEQAHRSFACRCPSAHHPSFERALARYSTPIWKKPSTQLIEPPESSYHKLDAAVETRPGGLPFLSLFTPIRSYREVSKSRRRQHG